MIVPEKYASMISSWWTLCVNKSNKTSFDVLIGMMYRVINLMAAIHECWNFWYDFNFPRKSQWCKSICGSYMKMNESILFLPLAKRDVSNQSDGDGGCYSIIMLCEKWFDRESDWDYSSNVLEVTMSIWTLNLSTSYWQYAWRLWMWQMPDDVKCSRWVAAHILCQFRVTIVYPT